ncbi:MAG TPA: hypothetical protein VK968_05425, partial [Roseimicrobium sp.]|nr:hypothetical protein [Roseimicrobium sp.]
MNKYVSRFMDGSASITVSELQQEWAGWNECDQVEFCNHSHCLAGQADYPEMLRFIMDNGGPRDWSSLAINIARHLPREEAFAFLVRVLQDRSCPSANVSKAISMTKHPDAESELRRHLADLWANPDLWKDDPFLNWICFDAATCIGHLVELGAPAGDFV